MKPLRWAGHRLAPTRSVSPRGGLSDATGAVAPTAAGSASAAEPGPDVRQRLRVPAPAGFPADAVCDVVETSAEHGLRILGFLPSSGCVLAQGRRWSWIVPAGSNIDVSWPSIACYRADAAVLVPYEGLRPREVCSHSVVHWSQGVPYTHPILLYFAACCIAGVEPAMTV